MASQSPHSQIQLKLCELHEGGYVLGEDTPDDFYARAIAEDPTTLFSYARDLYGREILSRMKFFVSSKHEEILKKTLEQCVALPITESFTELYREYTTDHKK